MGAHTKDAAEEPALVKLDLLYIILHLLKLLLRVAPLLAKHLVHVQLQLLRSRFVFLEEETFKRVISELDTANDV